MKNVTIISHLTPEEWKMSWNDKVVEDNRQNMRASQQSDCFWGHFTSDSDFIICHHKEFEIKGMSLASILRDIWNGMSRAAVLQENLARS